jgi:hypothetical protein
MLDLDGPYRLNRALDRAARLVECPRPDNLVWQDDHVLFTCGPAVLLLDVPHDGGEAEEILRFENPVTAMAAARDGTLAIGLAAGISIVGGEHDGSLVGGSDGSPTALCFSDPHTVFACMHREEEPCGGTLWRLDLRGAAPLCLASGLAGPAGLLLRNLDTLIVAERGRRRLLECPTIASRPPRVLIDRLPGDPTRLAPGAAGGFWLAVPSLGTEPHGLVLQFDDAGTPLRALHGAADGRSRGVTSCLETRGELIVACGTDNVLVSVDLLDARE